MIIFHKYTFDHIHRYNNLISIAKRKMNARLEARINEIVEKYPERFIDIKNGYDNNQCNNITKQTLLESIYLRECIRRILDPHQNYKEDNILNHPNLNQIYDDKYIDTQLKKIDDRSLISDFSALCIIS